MKKKLLLLTGALTVAALSVAIFAHKPMTAEEALLLKNVEAIAQNEGGGGNGGGDEKCTQNTVSYDRTGPCGGGEYKVVEKTISYSCFLGSYQSSCFMGYVSEYYDCSGIMTSAQVYGGTFPC